MAGYRRSTSKEVDQFLRNHKGRKLEKFTTMRLSGLIQKLIHHSTYGVTETGTEREMDNTVAWGENRLTD